MAFEIHRKLVEFILLGPEDDRRQLQDSPILGDVWAQFAKRPDEPLELLITPYAENPAGGIAATILDNLCDFPPGPTRAPCVPDIAYLQGVVAAKLTLRQMLGVVVPMTYWWNDGRMRRQVEAYISGDGQVQMRRDIAQILAAGRAWLDGDPYQLLMHSLGAYTRYIVLAGLLLWAADQKSGRRINPDAYRTDDDPAFDAETVDSIVVHLRSLYKDRREPEKRGTVWTVSLNRRAMPALTKSVPAVKADAARTLFSVDCSSIVWAVIDSGIDASHDAFRSIDGAGRRVRRTFDFTGIRDIVKLDGTAGPDIDQRVRRLLARPLASPPSDQDLKKILAELTEDARKGRSIDWGLVERLVEIDPDKAARQASAQGQPPADSPHLHHGTHVAGILGASKKGAIAAHDLAAATRAAPGDGGAGSRSTADEFGDWADGMCPDISIYDFRVLSQSLVETEFAIIAALQFIRYINDRNSYMTIHGANLSLSIPHDVRNYACGRTPICNECERLVNSGVVVVAAAGNRGYQGFETKAGTYESYAAFSVTDPGNADGVITVGATHRYWPHTYGVSFFSSRGPTGDGRLKPDLVAPGERIRAPISGNDWGDLDGTSMAAPHVSGAAAMLMARYSELVGQPRRIKSILCESATDLKRERTFQGHGMLDVLRAFQSI